MRLLRARCPSLFLYRNLLPGVPPIAQIDTNPATVHPSNVRTTKNAVVHLAIAPNNTGIHETEADHFRAMELLGRSSAEKLVKVSFGLHLTRLVFTHCIYHYRGRELRNPPSRSAAG